MPINPGDSVKYTSGGADSFNAVSAVVNLVRANGTVDVTVTDSQGITHARMAIPVVDSQDQAPRDIGFVVWP